MTSVLNISQKLIQDMPKDNGNLDFDVVSKKLFKIFEDELSSENSIFLKVDINAIAKIVMFLTGQINRSVSVGIAGETASGKSTVTQDIITSIEEFAKKSGIKNSVIRINTDDYYYDRSDMVKACGSFANFAKNYDLDIPEAFELDLMKKHILQLLNGNPVWLPKYDMSGTAIRHDHHTLANPSKIIISEGLFSLTSMVRDAFDFKIYVDVSEEIQAKRFFIRAKERNLGSSSKNILENATEKAKIYIRPCKEISDIVLSGEADRDKYKAFLIKFLSVVEEFYSNKVIIG